MFAGENQQCYVVQEVHDREFILIKVAVENDQTCFKEANITCSVTAISGLRMTPQPVYIEVGHGTFNFTGFQRCLQYSAICYILHDGYQPAICEADIDEFMSECIYVCALECKLFDSAVCTTSLQYKMFLQDHYHRIS